MKRLDIAAVSALCVASVFVLAGLACDSIVIAVADSATSPVGDVSIRHSIGPFELNIRECCNSEGQIVADFGVTCRRQARCAEYQVASADVCEHFDSKLDRVAVGTSRCEEIRRGTLTTAVISCLVLICSIVTCFAFIVGRIPRAVVIAISASSCASCVCLLIVAQQSVLEVEKEWLVTRYQRSSAGIPPVNLKFGPTFALLATAIALFASASVLAVTAAVLYRTKEHVPVAASRSHVLTPAPSNPVVSTFSSKDVLPLCPNDATCSAIDDLRHQLDFVHSCRLPFCTDTSVAHRRHFAH